MKKTKKSKRSNLLRKVRGTLLSVTMVFMAFVAYAETVSISTYYPSPYGSYQTLETTAGTSLATNSGNVGIGTANAAVKLHVHSSNNAETRTDSAAGWSGYSMSAANQSRAWVYQSAGDPTLKLFAAGDDRMFINNTGVGVGTAPSYRLDVNGVVNIRGNISSTNGLRLTDEGGQSGILRVDCDGTWCWPVYM